jgi:protease-4
MSDAQMEGRSQPQRAPERRQPGKLGSMAKGCLIVAVAGVAVLALSMVALVLLVAAAVAGSASHVVGQYRGVAVQEATVSGVPGDPKIAIIPVRGVLMPDAGPLGGAHPVRLLQGMLQRAEEGEVRVVVLAVNTPGGGITTCDVMHKTVREFRRATGVPVLALMEDVAASGGYYVSCAADHIIAHPTTTTGSIGVMMPLYDASRLLRTIGIADRSVKSGPFKDLGSPFADKTPEQRERERELLKGVIEAMHERFVQVVAEGRELEAAEVRGLADGRIFTSARAAELGLIDSVGYEEDAVEKARELAGLERAHVVQYSRVPSLGEMLFMWGRGDVTVRVDGLPGAAQQGDYLMYLWRPPAGAPAP